MSAWPWYFSVAFQSVSPCRMSISRMVHCRDIVVRVAGVEKMEGEPWLGRTRSSSFANASIAYAGRKVSYQFINAHVYGRRKTPYSRTELALAPAPALVASRDEVSSDGSALNRRRQASPGMAAGLAWRRMASGYPGRATPTRAARAYQTRRWGTAWPWRMREQYRSEKPVAR